MKNLRNLFAAVTLMAVLMIGVSSANAGILMTDLKGDNPQPCTETKTDSKTDWGVIVQDIVGVIVQDFMGVIVQDFTGVIVQDAADTQTECGIIITD